MSVAQLGARMHYAVPQILARAGNLDHFYTDASPVKGWPRLLAPLSLIPGGAPLKRFFGRLPLGLPPKKITAFHAFGFDYALRRSRAHTDEAQAAVFLWAGQKFCQRLIDKGLQQATHTFTYNSAGLEWMRHAKSRGRKTVMEQTIAPKEQELKLLRLQQELFPEWEAPRPEQPHGALKEYCQREKAEWAEADLILCGSEFVKDAIQASQGPVERCVVVPYGVEGPREPVLRSYAQRQGPLRVLTVGAVGLRKGSPTLIETARMTDGRCEFRLVGPVAAPPKVLRGLPPQVALLGPVPRSELRAHFEWADVFFLPSVCEGSATAVYEALAHGLPVLTTLNAGSVVTHGVDGWLAPVGDAREMAARLDWILRHRPAMDGFSARALATAGRYGTDSYGQRLLQSLALV
jgi:hypothetical protein